MRRRRRYEVVVEGLYGQAAAQRSVISDHRSEPEARENAELECRRLQVIYGEAASSWRIRVVRDGETVHELIPEGGGTRRRSVEPLPPTPPPEPEDVVAEPEPEPAPRDEPQPEPEPEAGERSGDGPVPDWLIARFEESIARQRERTYGPSVRDDERGRSDR